jgi:diguanylate cyclase (GGDEF)-like protein
MARVSLRTLIAAALGAIALCAAAAVGGREIVHHQTARATAGATHGVVVGAVNTSEWLAAALSAAVAALVIAAAAGLYHRASVRERARGQRVALLRDHLQVSGSETESRRLLLRHAGQAAPQSGAAVLSLLESEDRLEPTLGERVADTPLRAMPLGRMRSGSCLAVRLAREHTSEAVEGQPGTTAAAHLTRCEVCGRLPGAVACTPIRFAGRTLGSLLVTAEDPLPAAARAELREAVAVSAPVMALQRTLDVTARRSAVDPLTGLPNRLAAEDTMRRLSAQAGRTIDPLAAVLIDLDRFKLVNDRFGYALGDAALKVVAKVLSAHVRASDFVARYGGEEFLVLAPNTDRTGAVELAEKLRQAIERTELQVIGRMTASFGVAALPEDAVEPESLLREADRAVYVAKALGRNRVQEADPTTASEG